jgi:CSLREA domain-containing protein
MARARLAALLIAAAVVAGNAVAITGTEASDLAVDVPAAAEPGRSVAIQLRLPRQVGAIDGRLYFDTSAGTVVGIAPLGGGTTLGPVEIDGGIAFGAYGLRPVDGLVRLRVVLASAPGSLRFRLAVDSAADASGRRIEVGRQALGALRVAGGNRLHRLPGAGPRFAPKRPAGRVRAVEGRDRIGKADLDVVRAAWELSRLNTEACSPARYSDADANGDGCIDVADLQALLAAQGASAGRGADTAALAEGALAATTNGFARDVQPFAAPNRTFVVTSTSDTADANPGDGVCADSQGRCTLRAAITETNWSRGEDLIQFNLPGTAPVRIQLSGTQMPLLNDRTGGVTIDGYSQPGSRVNTAASGSNAIPGVEIVGTAGSPRGNALRITSAGNVIRGLIFNNHYRPVVFDGPDAKNNRFVGNWVGINANGTAASYNANVGVLLNNGVADNVIGAPALADANVIGRANKAVFLTGSGTDHNVLQNNFICMTPSGTEITAGCATGIDHDFGPKRNLIGGNGANERNVIGATNLNGIEFSHGWDPGGTRADGAEKWQINHNRVIGNWIGFRGDGSYNANFRSGLTDGGNGQNGNAVNVFDGSNFTIVERNWLASAYDGINIALANATGSVIRDNVIGQSPLGQAAPMGRWGIRVRDNTRAHVIEGNSISNAAQGGIGLLNGNVRQIRLSRNLVSNTSGPAIYLARDSNGTANNGLASPVITQATTIRAAGTGIAGATVEVFRASRAAGQSGLPSQFLGSAVVASNGTWSVPIIVASGDRVTALQINPNNNTSALGTNVSATFESPPPPPSANFTFAQQQGNLTVDFTDTSTGSPSQWSWNFGDGTGSTQRNPSKAYVQPGTYSVTLTATNAGGSSSRTRSVTVVAPAANVVAADGFGRSVSNGWGSADTGGAYSLQGTAASFTVADGAGVIQLPAAGATRSALLNSTSAQDVDISFRVRTDKTLAGGNAFIYAVARRVGASNSEYRPRIILLPDGSVRAHASVLVNGSESPLASPVTVPGLSHTAGAYIWFRAQVTGANPTTVRVRVWADGQSEPTTWHFSATNTAAGLQGPGSLGLRAYIAGAVTNAPITFRFDDYVVTSDDSPTPPPDPNVAADGFGRTTSNGWGSADTGGAYSLQGTAANFSVGEGSGSIVVPNAGNTRSALLNSTSAQDVDISFRVRTDKTLAGGNAFIYAVARRVGASNSEYRPRIILLPDGSVRAHASVLVNGSESPLASPVTVPGLSHTAGAYIWFRAQVTGANPTTVRVRVWADGQSEPTTWHFSATNTAAGLQGPGSLGLRAYLAGAVTNAPIRFDFDDYAVVSVAP